MPALRCAGITAISSSSSSSATSRERKKPAAGQSGNRIFAIAADQPVMAMPAQQRVLDLPPGPCLAKGRIEGGGHHRHDPVDDRRRGRSCSSTGKPRVGRAAIERGNFGGQRRSAREQRERARIGPQFDSAVPKPRAATSASAWLPAISVTCERCCSLLGPQRGEPRQVHPDRRVNPARTIRHARRSCTAATGSAPMLGAARHRRDQRQRRIADQLACQASASARAAASPTRTPVKLPGPSATAIRSARPLFGQRGDHRHQLFGMAARRASAVRPPTSRSSSNSATEQASVAQSITSVRIGGSGQAIRLKTSKSGRGLNARRSSRDRHSPASR